MELLLAVLLWFQDPQTPQYEQPKPCYACYGCETDIECYQCAIQYYCETKEGY